MRTTSAAEMEKVCPGGCHFVTAHRSRRWCLDPLREWGSDKGSNPSPPEQRIWLLAYVMRARLQHHHVTNILTASSHNCALHMPQLAGCLTPPATAALCKAPAERLSTGWAPSAHALSELVPASSLCCQRGERDTGGDLLKSRHLE